MMAGRSRWTLGIAALGLALMGCEPAEQEVEQEFEEPGAEEERTAERPAGGEMTAFTEWDADGNRELAAQEFEAWWDDAGPFDRWDADGNGNLSREELQATNFQVARFAEWDADQSGDLSEEELREALFDRWDTNGDGVLTQREWSVAIQRIQGSPTSGAGG